MRPDPSLLETAKSGQTSGHEQVVAGSCVILAGNRIQGPSNCTNARSLRSWKENMRLRFSLLNLLLATTILALVIVIIRLHAELAQEHSLRVQQLQHGGILQVGDLNAVHVVQVSTRGELNQH